METKNENYFIPENGEDFLKEFLNDFYHKVVYTKDTDDFENFESSIIKWIDDIKKLEHVNLKTIAELMENHHQSELWFSGLIGFFYQHGIGKDERNRNKALESYLSAIHIENENLNGLDEVVNNDNHLKEYNVII